MAPFLASHLLFDTDQDALFEVDDLVKDKVWKSARVYKSVKGKSIEYEVWLYEWDPQSNEEKSTLLQTFQDLEEAKRLANKVACN